MILKRNCVLKHFIKLRFFSCEAKRKEGQLYTVVNGCQYPRDEWTNVTDKVLSYVGRNLHLQKDHPLSLMRQRIVNFFYKSFVGRTGNAIFSVYDDLNPIVTIEENYDSLLVPKDHPSRKKNDCYYLNASHLLRAHTTAHQSHLIKMGLSNFLMIGDVYRRDEIDATHYPVFHQVDGVRICTGEEVFRFKKDVEIPSIFDANVTRSDHVQAGYNEEASTLMVMQMKDVLEKLAVELFGKDVKTRWVNAYFPFTHPSLELEVLHNDEWMEVLGCGIIERPILMNAGAFNHIGWAFGLGLERLAMHLYDIPDIRLFWSRDSGFLSQFNVTDPSTPIKYKPISIYPQCTNDLSFWLSDAHPFYPQDFYDLVRTVGGDMIEQVSLIDEFTHPKNKKTSHCYRIVYRHLEKTLTQQEVNIVHKKIEEAVASQYNVVIR